MIRGHTNIKFNWHVCKNRSLDPTLSHFNPVHPFPSTSIWSPKQHSVKNTNY